MSTTIRMADGDIYINSAGRSETIEGTDKCSQDIAEVLMTEVAERDFGSELASLTIPEPVQVFAGRALISKKVDEAIQRLRRMQQQDPYITADEQIERISRLVVEQFGPTDYVFWVNVVLRNTTVTSDQLLGVSLRHQESWRFAETIMEQVRTLTGTTG